MTGSNGNCSQDCVSYHWSGLEWGHQQGVGRVIWVMKLFVHAHKYFYIFLPHLLYKLKVRIISVITRIIITIMTIIHVFDRKGMFLFCYYLTVTRYIFIRKMSQVFPSPLFSATTLKLSSHWHTCPESWFIMFVGTFSSSRYIIISHTFRTLTITTNTHTI